MAKYPFYAAIAAAVFVGFTILSAAPTFVDMGLFALASVGGVTVGRLSRDWF